MERKRTNTEKLVITAILIALEVILTRFVGISTPMLRSGIGHQSSGEYLLAHHYPGQRLYGNAAGQIRQRAPLRANRHRTDSRAEQSNPANFPAGSLKGI